MTRVLSVMTLHQIAPEETDCLHQTSAPSPAVTPETRGCNFDSGKDESTDEVLPGTVSVHRHLRKDFSNVTHSTTLEDCKACPRVAQSLEVQRCRCREVTLTLHRIENIEQNVCLWNKDLINLGSRLINPAKITKTQEAILYSFSHLNLNKHKRAQKKQSRAKKNQPEMQIKILIEE
jgi:shugoshin-like 1